MPSVYIPKRKEETSCHSTKVWMLDMRHLRSAEKEVTFVFSFTGRMKDAVSAVFEYPDNSVLKSVVEKDLELIRHINECPFKIPNYATVSMSLIICNFMDNVLLIKDPYMSSGMLDSSYPWTKSIKESSVECLYTRKKTLDARGSVGTTLISLQNGPSLFSIVVHWNAPYDFNLFKNSFVVFPLPGQHYDKSQQIARDFRSFLDYSNISKKDDTFRGIRGFAKDGPKALEFGGMLISVKMGAKHTDYLQLSIIPLHSDDKVKNS